MADVKKRLNDASLTELTAEPSGTDLIMVVPSGTGVAEKMSYTNFKVYVLTAANISGLGTIATQNASAVAVTGGSITGITDLAVADGGTGASTAAGARSNLGLAIGTDVQGYDADLNDIAGLSPAKGTILVYDGTNWNVQNVGTNTHVLTADSAEATGLKWAASAGGGASLTVDTRANILATASPSSGDMFYATDTEEFFIHDGSDFQVSPLEHQAVNALPDVGLPIPMVFNDLAGYSEDYIARKTIYNSKIGESSVAEDDGIRTSNGTLQFYANGQWNDVVTGFRFREDSSEGSSGNFYELEHRPVGLDNWYQVMNGYSDELGSNGFPLTQQYSTVVGVYPAPIRVKGRSFD